MLVDTPIDRDGALLGSVSHASDFSAKFCVSTCNAALSGDVSVPATITESSATGGKESLRATRIGNDVRGFAS
ncbi:MAG: hypothetical protein ACYTEL_05645 [Planctomycetota bacterium]